jgi:hypothetical protein
MKVSGNGHTGLTTEATTKLAELYATISEASSAKGTAKEHIK